MGKQKEGNKTVQITLPTFHLRKLDLVCSRTGLKRSDVVQRMIENYNMFTPEEKK